MSLQTPESGLGVCLAPEGCQNQDWVCVSLRRGARIRIGCVSRSGGVEGHGLRVKKSQSAEWWGLPTKHPRSLPIRIYASCKTGRLRARKRLTPLSKKLSPGMSFRVANAHANNIKANGHCMPSSDRSTPNVPGSGPGRTRLHFHWTHLSPL
jgi:hypothetical protein